MATRLEMLKQQWNDNNGDPLSGGKVYTYIVGTDTAKATYTDAGAGTPQANPIVLNTRGEADSDIYGDGYYKIVVKDSADTTIRTIASIAGNNTASFTTIGDYSNDFDAAITAIGATETTLYIDATAAMSANVTVPSNVHLVVLKGGQIDRNGNTLTINGTLEAGPYSIFDSAAGTVNINANEYVMVDWFGSAKDETTIANMKSFLGSTNHYQVKFAQTQQNWSITNTIAITDNFTVEIPSGCEITVDAAQTLTFQGPIIAGPYHCFNIDGTLALAQNPVVYAEWFGAIDGSADETQINLAIDVATTYGGTVQLLPRTYTLTAPVLMEDNVILRGSGASESNVGTVLSQTGDQIIISFASKGENCGVYDMRLVGDNGTSAQHGISCTGSGETCFKNGIVSNVVIEDVGGNGIDIYRAENCIFDNVVVDDPDGNCAHLQNNNPNEYAEQLTFRNCRFSNSDSSGFVIESCRYIVLSNCYINDCALYGININGDAATDVIRNITIENGALYNNYPLNTSLRIYADAVTISDIVIRNCRITVPGTDVGEKAFSITENGAVSIDRVLFDNIPIHKVGATAPDVVFSVSGTTTAVRLRDIADTIHADSTYVIITAEIAEYTSTYAHGFVTGDNTATPDVAGIHFLSVDSDAAADITGFDNGYEGQMLTVLVTGGGAVTFSDGVGNLAMAGDLVGANTGDTIQFIFNGTNWYEISRSVN